MTTATGVRYRDAEPRDAQRLALFSRDSFVETFGDLYPRADLDVYCAEKYGTHIQAAEIADPGTHYRLAFEGDEIVGYCKTGALDLPVDGPGLELHRLYVAERVKGLGVANVLMDEAIDWARGQGAEAIYLSVWENNARAQAFYRRYGFEHIGEHAFMVGTVRDRDFLWKLQLK